MEKILSELGKPVGNKDRKLGTYDDETNKFLNANDSTGVDEASKFDNATINQQAFSMALDKECNEIKYSVESAESVVGLADGNNEPSINAGNAAIVYDKVGESVDPLVSGVQVAVPVSIKTCNEVKGSHSDFNLNVGDETMVSFKDEEDSNALSNVPITAPSVPANTNNEMKTSLSMSSLVHAHLRLRNGTKSAQSSLDYSNNHKGGFDEVVLLAMEREKAKIRVGRFIMGDDVLHAKKYCFLPSAYLENSSFSFDEVFDKLRLERPSTLFRILQAGDVDTWNVRLPLSRSHLSETLYPNSAKSLIKPKNNRIFPYMSKLSDKVHSDDLHLGDMFGMGGGESEEVPVVDESKHDVEEGKQAAGTVPLPVQHYQAVLRENSKRLLRESCEALSKVGACVRMNAAWASDTPVDYIAEWIKDDTRDPIPTLGIANIADYHDDIWAQLDDGASHLMGGDEDVLVGNEVIIDPTPFYTGRISTRRNSITQFVEKSMPHPGLTHLILTDNPILLEKKLAACCPAGLIMFNGSVQAAQHFTTALLKNQPIILFKYTGYTTDMACEMLERADKLTKARRKLPSAIPERPFPDDMVPGYHHRQWLKPFDSTHVADCNKLNVAVENFPHRFNPSSIFVVDLFHTSGDDLQDKITQTMSVVFSPPHELGGDLAEARRLTIAWRMRLQCVYNAKIFKLRADCLNFFLILFILLSTVAAVWLTYIDLYGELFVGFDNSALFHEGLSQATLLLPLVATILRGLVSILNPMAKYIALQDAGAEIEGEIYRYRCKVGKYSSSNSRSEAEEWGKKDEASDGKKKNQVKAGPPKPPRERFSNSLDAIWKRLAASDISNGSLSIPPARSGPLDDINRKIKQNREQQMMFFEPLVDRALELDAMSAFEEEQSESEEWKGTFAKATRTKQIDHLYRSTEGTVDFDTMLDYGISAMSADDYIRMRLVPVLAELSTKTPSLSKRSIRYTVFAIFLSVSASALATFGLAVFIPLALALAGAFSGWGNYNQVELKLAKTNTAIHNLNELLVWWEGLTVIEKRVPKNKDRLVMFTEHVMQGQATILSAGAAVGGEASDGESDAT